MSESRARALAKAGGGTVRPSSNEIVESKESELLAGMSDEAARQAESRVVGGRARAASRRAARAENTT